MPIAVPVPAQRLHDSAILVVDDEEANLRLLARILERAGFTNVATTSNPRDVVPLLSEREPDLILLDLRMPELDGFGVLEQLRAVGSDGDYLPVLAITGDASVTTRQRAIKAGAKDFLEKPFEMQEVIIRVENLLTTRLLHRSLRQQNEQLEQIVQERTAELRAALHAAETANRAKSNFLATMSHELRTPLNAVIGFANHLRKNKGGNLRPQDLTFLERITDNGRHLLSIIDDILDLSRVEAGKLDLAPAPVALDGVIREVIDHVIAAHPSADGLVSARVAVPQGIQPLLTDERTLRRILVNLVSNAAKFTSTGFYLVGVCPDAAGKPKRIDVLDTGVGIPKDRLAAVFGIFEQGDSSTQRKFGGTGLGLAISRTLSERLGYRLSVVSQLGTGSAFSILLEPGTAPPASYAELADAYDRPPILCA